MVQATSNEGYRWRGTTMGGILGYLNKAENSPNSRALRILNLMLDMQPTKRSLKTVDVVRKKALLDEELAKYQFIPDLYPAESGDWTIQWHVVARGSLALARMDATIVQIILNFATAGEIHRFRKCADCSRWLYARVRHQKFCSMKCLQKNFARSEKSKLYRRNYMRKYRRDTM